MQTLLFKSRRYNGNLKIVYPLKKFRLNGLVYEVYRLYGLQSWLISLAKLTQHIIKI